MTELVQPIKRVEQYLYALCVLDFSNIPVPRSRLEIFTHAMITGEIPEIAPETREEEYMVAIIKGDVANLPTPKSRADHLLYRICLGETEIRDIELETRYEMLLAYLAEHGATDLEYALINFTKAFETLYNTVEMPVKSAILKGNTIINLVNNFTFGTGVKETDNYFTLTQTNTAENIGVNIETSLIELNKDYTLIYFIQEKTTTVSTSLVIKQASYLAPSGNATITQNIGWNKIKFNLSSFGSTRGLNIAIASSEQDGNYIKFAKNKFALLAGDWTNKNIPFNTVKYGMQSVKMPVLTTQNSILSDIRNYTVKAGRSWEGKEELGYSELISFNGNNVVFKHTGSSTRGFMIQGIPYCSKGSLALTLKHKRKPENFDGTLFCNFTLFKDGVFVYQTGNIQPTYESNTNLYTFTTTLSHDFDSMWITMGISTGEVGEHEFEFVLSKLKTNNTEYKSNILTVNEDVELRGIEDVQDELNLLTGEVTERIGKIILDGTQSSVTYNSEYSNDDYYFFMYDITKNGYKKAPSSPIGISCPIPFQQNKMFPWTTAKEFVLIDSNNLVVKLLKSKLNNDNSISSLNTYLASNPITINYPLKTESVKTVDLSIQDQDDQPTKLKTFNDVTYVETQADSVLPTVILEYGTKNEEVLAALSQDHEEVADAQAALSDAIDSQSDEVETTMMALTEVYEGGNQE